MAGIFKFPKQFDNLDEYVANRIARLPQVCQDALNEGAEVVLEDAKSLVPVKTGALRDSGRIEPGLGDLPSVTIAFGGDGVDYALRVHEDLEMRHPNGGIPKYLEEAYLRNEDYLLRLIGERIMELFNAKD